MLSVAVGWQVYEITGKALALGFSGLALFLPGFLLALPGGHVADRRDRRTHPPRLSPRRRDLRRDASRVMAFARRQRSLAARSTACSVCSGRSARSAAPAGQALMPSLVERKELERAVALGSSSWQLAMIAGPSLGGALYAATGTRGRRLRGVHGDGARRVRVGARDRPAARRHATCKKREPRDAGARSSPGIRYVWSNKPILGAISLDLFAVLLGGAVALLPIFARDLLAHRAVGPRHPAERARGRRGDDRASRSRGSRCSGRAGVDRCSRASSLFGIATIVFGAVEELRALARRARSSSARPT